MFGPAIGRANQGGSRRVKTQVLHVRADATGARRRRRRGREGGTGVVQVLLFSTAKLNSDKRRLAFRHKLYYSLHAVVGKYIMHFNSYIYHLQALNKSSLENNPL